jgi:hypothetical protein
VLGLLLTSTAVGHDVSRTGRYRVFPIIGGLVMAVGLYLLSRMDAGTTVLGSSLAMFVLGLGIGLSMQVLTIAVQNSVPYSSLGAATSGITFLRTMGSAFGTAIFGTLYANFLSDRLPEALAKAPNVSPAALSTPSALHALGNAAIAPIIDAYAWALDHVFLWSAPVALVAFLLAFLLPAGRLSDDLQPSAADLGEGFGAPQARSAEDRIAQRIAHVLYAPRGGGLIAMLERADLGLDEGRLWALLQVEGLTDSGRDASPAAIARSHRVPTVLLAPAFADLANRGLVAGSPDRLYPTADGRALTDRTRTAFRAWLVDQLVERHGPLTPTEQAAVNQVLDRIARRLVREEADVEPILSVGSGRAGAASESAGAATAG